MAQTDTKQTFTVAEANRLLPLVRSIVTDVVAEYRRIREIERERRALQVGAGSATSEVKEQTRRQSDDLKVELEERSLRIDSYLKEAADLGAEVKDLDKGLVDFPSLRGGRAVWLCWNLGEESVSHWHGVSETADDRRPIEAAKRTATPPTTAPGALPVDPKATGPAPSAPPSAPGAGPKAANGRGGDARGGDAPA